MQGLRQIFILSLFLAVFSSCSKFEKVLKSSDFELKYKKAIEYYEKHNYSNAITLFEELIPVFKGTQRAEEIYYYYAYCHYYQGDYALAGYHFRNYSRTYYSSKHTEECAYMNAYCYYLNSPHYTLDQSDTKFAIQEMQAFINNFPISTKIDTCNQIISKLRGKLEKKSYEIIKQYYKLSDWKAVNTEGENFLKDFAESNRVEEIKYMIIKSLYNLALNSIESKKVERIDKAIENYLKFVDLHPSSQYLKDVESVYTDCLKFKNTKNTNN